MDHTARIIVPRGSRGWRQTRRPLTSVVSVAVSTTLVARLQGGACSSSLTAASSLWTSDFRPSHERSDAQ